MAKGADVCCIQNDLAIHNLWGIAHTGAVGINADDCKDNKCTAWKLKSCADFVKKCNVQGKLSEIVL